MFGITCTNEIFDLGSLELKKLSKFFSGRVPVLLHPSLYRAVKLAYPTDVDGTIRDGRITTEIGTGSLG